MVGVTKGVKMSVLWEHITGATNPVLETLFEERNINTKMQRIGIFAKIMLAAVTNAPPYFSTT